MSDAVATDGLAALPSVVRWIGAAAFILAIPLFIILGNVLEVAGDRDFYATEFEKYRVDQVTGLNRDELAAVSDLFIAYLSNPSARLDIEFVLGGVRRPLFNEKKLSHMEDVQKLFGLVRQARIGAGAILLILPLVAIGMTGGGMLPRLGTLLVTGGLLTIVLLGLAGLLSLVDFTEAFIKFHQMAFSNDNWMLDPRTDYLIMLFPEGFWLDATLRIATQSAIEAAVLGAVGLGIRYFGVRR